MRKPLLLTIILMLLASAAAAMALVYLYDRPQWTTSSREAREEFEQGLLAEIRFYRADAMEHYARALELDPNFVMARVKIAQLTTPGSRDKLLALLQSIDLDRLSRRERALIEVRRSQLEQRPREETNAIIDRYLEKTPRDPHVLALRCNDAWTAQDWDRARNCYQAIIDADPNWVNAVNNLGYIAMAQERFDDAEEQFATYRYLAPDQANPYDSMGELLTLRGREDEARDQFLKAIDTRPDYCASWRHLIELEHWRNNLAQARTDLDRALRESGCESVLKPAECLLALDGSSAGSRADELLESGPCAGTESPQAMIAAHRIALERGQKQAALAIERRVEELEQAPRGEMWRLIGAHLQGIRALKERRYPQAVQSLRGIDDRLVWFGGGQGLFRLYNRAALAAALEKAGDREAAESISAASRAINPRFDQQRREMQRF